MPAFDRLDLSKDRGGKTFAVSPLLADAAAQLGTVLNMLLHDR